MLLHSIIIKILRNFFMLLKTIIRKILEETVVLKDAKSGYDRAYPGWYVFPLWNFLLGWSILLISKTCINILLDPEV